MKVSMGKMFMFFAIVLCFSAVPAAWAHVESIEGPYLVEGTVAYAWGDSLAIACGYTMEPDALTGCPLVVSGMGPAGWWSLNEVTFPTEGQEVILSIYRVTSSVGDIKYVAGEVTNVADGDWLVLRVPVYEGDVVYVLNPAWSKMEPLAQATALTSASGEDTECACKCTCKGEECACDCICESSECDDCTPVGDEHKWRGKR